MPDMNTRATMQVTRSLALSSEPEGGLICIRGKHLGHLIPLPGDRALTVGRDPSVCQIVLDDGQVSRKHCQITYIASLNKYRVVDVSKNGTFLGNGRRLERGKEYYVDPAEELYMGNQNNLYKFR